MFAARNVGRKMCSLIVNPPILTAKINTYLVPRFYYIEVVERWLLRRHKTHSGTIWDSGFGYIQNGIVICVTIDYGIQNLGLRYE